jgi:hypothetical protein
MMATNPKLPDYPNIPSQKPAHEHGKIQLIRQSKFPWPILALIAAAALLIVIIAVLPKAPHVTAPPTGALIPEQPTAEQVQLTNLNVTRAPVGDAAYLTAVLHNTGNSAITGVQVQAEFLGRNGPALATVTRPVEGVVNKTESQDLTQAPIKPDEARPIRIYFEHTPKGWNHQLPQLTVTAVTATTP